MRRCAATFPVSSTGQAYCGVGKVRLIPLALRALPADLFTKPSIMAIVFTFYEFISNGWQVKLK